VAEPPGASAETALVRATDTNLDVVTIAYSRSRLQPVEPLARAHVLDPRHALSEELVTARERRRGSSQRCFATA